MIMAGGPRKFSEKIALLNQKEAEVNAAFNSIMGEIAQVRTNNSGSQLDMNQLDEINPKKKDKFENFVFFNVPRLEPKLNLESMNFNEHISVTYDNQQNNNFGNQYQAPKVKKREENKKDNLQPMQNSFLQLPNQTDPFRRALSDSSINQTVTSAPNSHSFHSNNLQSNYVQNYQQQNQPNNYQNYPSANFHLSFSDYDTQQSASNMAHVSTSNVPQQKFFKNFN
ncbi:hypothetical protein BpHYR1_003047 [Brachionus plicatilis]|uniref:Transducer of regulated CREB activity N-terminal domain-containing protein n=1 Tax=Brachionus plicatilis TaxID=10195 RepID=A0A3M7QZN7_BRAPC|nr:hypothetical protein BpHYR1_003047 [Brachionus plicatilis]